MLWVFGGLLMGNPKIAVVLLFLAATFLVVVAFLPSPYKTNIAAGMPSGPPADTRSK